ncbi:MAG: sensor histidine kinase [Nitrosopumilus sp.]|nr:sensor histidine kinase [Nitrosopumilus sp.]
MKINVKLIVLFSAIMVAVTATLGFLAFNTVEASVIDSELLDMQNIVHDKSNQIETLHSRASEDIVFAAQNPKFSDYFDLSDTKSGNIYNDDGVIQFTSEQRKLKSDLEDWIYHFQNKFTVDETCYIDRTGQQQGALILKAPVPDEHLSSTKKSEDYFEPSFEKDPGESYVQYPYVSPATKRWVFAYTTPIVTSSDGQKSGFYHFEMPIYVFQDVIKSDVGRMFVIDPEGFLIADSNYNYSNKPGSGYMGQPHEEYFPSIDSISDSEDFAGIVSGMNSLEKGQSKWATYDKNGEKYFVAYKKLPTFNWIIGYEVPRSQLLAGENDLFALQINLILLTSLMSAGGLVAIIMVSSRITHPIKILADSCKKQDVHNLKEIDLVTDDEINDVTKALNNMIKQVNEIGQMKEEFSSMVTHELKTPLTPILGWCQTLKNPKIMGELSEKQRNAIEKIQTNAKRLQQLIGDILDAEKLDMQKMKFDFQEINVTDFMNYLHKNLQRLMDAKEIKYINDTEPNLKLITDKNRLEQVLTNLVLNAVDFVPNKGLINIGAQDKGDSVLFFVKDNGVGIDKDKISNLFSKFYQVETSMTRSHGGTGLGLAICKGIIDGFHGKIWVESIVNKGSTFYFTIPKDSIRNNTEKN